jgi:hypothetical protein
MREIELLTETSTQIRTSALPKTPRFALMKGEQEMIAGTKVFGKYFLHRDFHPFPKRKN